MKRILKKEIELSNIVNQKIDDAFETNKARLSKKQRKRWDNSI